MPRPLVARLTLPPSQPAVRLDRALRDGFPLWGRQAVQRLIAARKVKVNGRPVWIASWEVRGGDRLEVADPPADKPAPVAKFDDAWIIAEQPDLIAVNKPAGLLSQATQWSQGGDLLALAQQRFGEVLLFHRLDRDTSGIVLLTRPGPVNAYLDAAFKQHTIVKQYLAVVATPNALQPSGVIEARLAPDSRRRDKMQVAERGGQRAVTRYAIEDQTKGRQLVRMWPETGRTHQLRVHLAHLGAPIIGDRLYGKPPRPEQRLLLHAERLSLPAANDYDAREFLAPLPEGFWPKSANEAR